MNPDFTGFSLNHLLFWFLETLFVKSWVFLWTFHFTFFHFFSFPLIQEHLTWSLRLFDAKSTFGIKVFGAFMMGFHLKSPFQKDLLQETKTLSEPSPLQKVFTAVKLSQYYVATELSKMLCVLQKQLFLWYNVLIASIVITGIAIFASHYPLFIRCPINLKERNNSNFC